MVEGEEAVKKEYVVMWEGTWSKRTTFFTVKSNVLYYASALRIYESDPQVKCWQQMYIAERTIHVWRIGHPYVEMLGRVEYVYPIRCCKGVPWAYKRD